MEIHPLITRPTDECLLMFIAIAGNIGSGKSTLTDLLSQHYGWEPFYESVENNPYIEDFYADMRRWSFHLQVYFLSQRFITHQRIAGLAHNVVQDRSIYEDAEIFAANLHDIGNMDDRDYTNYTELYGVMIPFLKPPDLLVYLRASVPTLMHQIRLRGRSYEQSIRESYITQLNDLYESWISRYTFGPVLTIETDHLDFVHSESDRASLLGRIVETVSSLHTPQLPFTS